MTAWSTEREAMLNMISHFGKGTFACVMDSYDYVGALEQVLPSVAKEKVGKGGYLVLRPDSGDPVEAVLQVRTPACHDLAALLASLRLLMSALQWQFFTSYHGALW